MTGGLDNISAGWYNMNVGTKKCDFCDQEIPVAKLKKYPTQHFCSVSCATRSRNQKHDGDVIWYSKLSRAGNEARWGKKNEHNDQKN